MEDLRAKYQKYKQKVKQWEDEFMKENARIPAKDDIKNANSTVRYAYKSYISLKRELSTKENKSSNKDEILSGVHDSMSALFSEDTNGISPPDTKTQDPCSTPKEACSNKRKEILPVFNSSGKLTELTARMDAMKKQLKRTSPEMTKTAPATPETPLVQNVEKVWGEHLNGSARKLKQRTASFQFTQKLFTSATFKSKRNPLLPHTPTPLRRAKSEVFSDFISVLNNKKNQENKAEEVKTSEDTQAEASVDKPEGPVRAEEAAVEDMEVAASSQESIFALEMFSAKCKFKVKDSSKDAASTKGAVASKMTANMDEGWIERVAKPKKPEKVAAPLKRHESMEMSQDSPAVASQPSCSQPSVSSEPVLMDSQSSVVRAISNFNLDSQASMSPMSLDVPVSEDDDDILIGNSDTEEPTKPSMVLKRQAPPETVAEVAFKKTKLNQQEVMEKKIAEGKLNENFVKVNLKKRVFVRGKKNTNFSKYKKMMYKRKQMDGGGGGGGGVKKGSCFTCGMAGHWSSNCPQNGGLVPLEEAELIDDSPYLTLEEANALASENKPAPRISLEPTESTIKPIMEPLYELDENGELPDTPLEVLAALKQFGYNSFRPGQEEAVMRIMCGLSSLVMLSTGAGKSLCYQLPAYMYFKKKGPCVALVVSPLVSLMDDQVNNMPGPLKGACLHSNMPPKQKLLVEQQIKDGDLHVLLVSPEAIINSDQHNLRGLLQMLPPVSFACVDEAHCVSQWSHNFRPSYLMLCKVLRQKLKVRTILGLTATATKSTAAEIAQNLGVPDSRIIADLPMPSNLVLSISRDAQRDTALLELLKGPRFSTCDSIIIYCIRREECDRIAGMLRTCLQDSKKRESTKRGAISWNAEVYHAGLTPFRRKQVQSYFMDGKLRIVVATVAFGMGINKNDLRGVIHYNMPSSFERYVQEVGRAGRDGKVAHCHLFLDSQGRDLSELRRHIYSDSVDRHTIRKLLLRVYKPCKCRNVAALENWQPERSPPPEGERQVVPETPEKACCPPSPVKCPGHEVAFSTADTVQALDMPEENILTLLCYLEQNGVDVLSPAYVTCKVISYGGPGALKACAKSCPPLAMAVALDQKSGKNHNKSTSIEFPVVDVAAAIGWESGQVKRHLKELEWRKVNGQNRRTQMVVQLLNPGLRVKAKGSLPPEELDQALDWLTDKVDRQERSKILQLEALFTALSSVSCSTVSECEGDVVEEKCAKLKEAVHKYFETDVTEFKNQQPQLLPGVDSEDQVKADVRAMVGTFSDSNFTGRAIARIFHGISSPCFPSQVWGRTRYWRLHLNDNFLTLCKIATAEILKMK